MSAHLAGVLVNQDFANVHTHAALLRQQSDVEVHFRCGAQGVWRVDMELVLVISLSSRQSLLSSCSGVLLQDRA